MIYLVPVRDGAGEREMDALQCREVTWNCWFEKKSDEILIAITCISAESRLAYSLPSVDFAPVSKGIGIVILLLVHPLVFISALFFVYHQRTSPFRPALQQILASFLISHLHLSVALVNRVPYSRSFAFWQISLMLP